MSERPIAERHEFTTNWGNEVAVEFDPQRPDHPDLFGSCTEVDLRLEILRLRGDLDALGTALLLAASQLAGMTHDEAGVLALIQEDIDDALRAAGLLPGEES